MDGMIHDCRMCGGKRPHNGKACLGCGTELIKCKPSRTNRRSDVCPGCTHHGPHKEIEHHRYRCLKCMAVFERPDVHYLDVRPDVNVEKQERLIEEIKRQRRKRA